MSELTPKEGDLKVWWIPQVPGKAFEVLADSEEEAVKICNVLAEYDEFQFREAIKGDYCNAGGVLRYEKSDNPGFDDDWYDAYDDNGEDLF